MANKKPENRNRCMVIGCEAACCHDVELVVRRTSLRNFLQGLNTAPEQISWEQLELTQEELPNNGLYIANSGNHFTVKIIGPCPHLNEDYSCGIYESRPLVCQRFRIGSQVCEYFRLREFSE